MLAAPNLVRANELSEACQKFIEEAPKWQRSRLECIRAAVAAGDPRYSEETLDARQARCRLEFARWLVENGRLSDE